MRTHPRTAPTFSLYICGHAHSLIYIHTHNIYIYILFGFEFDFEFEFECEEGLLPTVQKEFTNHFR